jgi:hypothetical protein
VAAGCFNCRRFLDESLPHCFTRGRLIRRWQKLLYIGTGFCCAFPERAKTPLSRPNKGVPSSKSAAVADRRREVRNRRSSGSGVGPLVTLADAPDLGFRNRRFQNVPFHFKKDAFYEREDRFWLTNSGFTKNEEKQARSSTTSSTQTRQTSIPVGCSEFKIF